LRSSSPAAGRVVQPSSRPVPAGAWPSSLQAPTGSGRPSSQQAPTSSPAVEWPWPVCHSPGHSSLGGWTSQARPERTAPRLCRGERRRTRLLTACRSAGCCRGCPRELPPRRHVRRRAASRLPGPGRATSRCPRQSAAAVQGLPSSVEARRKTMTFYIAPVQLPARIGLITPACRDVERMTRLFRDLGWPAW